MLDQRAVAVHDDLEPAAGRFLHVVGELPDVDRVKLAVAVRRRHVPFGLRVDRTGENDRSSDPERFESHGSPFGCTGDGA
jgi:hypothetical protein